MDEQVVPLEKKLITVVNSVNSKEEKLPALVRKDISQNRELIHPGRFCMYMCVVFDSTQIM